MEEQEQLEENKRWYDKNNDMVEILDVLRNQPDELIDNLAENIMAFSNIIRQNINDMLIEDPVTIGKERMLGYYKSFQRRRWYDRNWTILSIVNILSTLPEDDFKKIIQGLKDILVEMEIM